MKEFSSIVKRTDSPDFRAWVKKKLKVAVLTLLFEVKDWIIVISIEKGYRLLSYVCPQGKYYTPYDKLFFLDTVRYKCKAYK